MALYEYRCRKCGLDIEIEQGISADPKRLLYCPYCERMRPVKRLISRSTFVLKGSGWGKDGYGGKE